MLEAARFTPALRFPWLTRFYDPLVEWTLKEKRFKAALTAQARVRPGMRVLDFGCGTGTLAAMIARKHPGVSVVGLDPDAEIVARAREKAARAGFDVMQLADVDIRLIDGFVKDVDLPPASFDRVVSSLVFHHLTTIAKRSALERLFELLRPEGEIHIGDWGCPHNVAMRAAFLAVRLLDGFETTADAARGRLPDLLREAGFEAVEETHREMTVFGTLSLYRGRKPDRSPAPQRARSLPREAGDTDGHTVAGAVSATQKRRTR